MEAVYLEAQLREEAQIGKNKALRRQNLVPCVVYGEGKKTLALKIDRSHLVKFMHAHHGGENMIITLKVGSPDHKKAEEKPVLIKEMQMHPVSGDILHVDFNEISLTKRLTVQVPIKHKGEAVGVKQDGGTLEQILWEVDVECLPTQIPEKLEVDVANMKIGDSIHVRDLVAPADVVIKHDAEAIVFSLVPPHKEELPAEAGAEGGAEAAEPEVIKKEKKVEEGAEEEGKGEAKGKSEAKA
jgi:large subunit ribosomal protein L25